MILSPIEASIKRKIEAVGVPLKDWDVQINYGIKTGYNEAFIIDGKTRAELLEKCPEADSIIRPILRGRDIRKYHIDFDDKWLLFIPWHFPLHKNPMITGNSSEAEIHFQDEYPTVYEHLTKYKTKLSARNKAETGIRYEWYALQRCAASYSDEFEKEKIVYSEIVQDAQFALDLGHRFVNDTCFIITGSHLKYILACLNSSLVSFFFKKFYAGGGLGETGYRYKKVFLERLPLPIPSVEIEQRINDIVDTLNSLNDKSKKTHLISEIESIIYKLYAVELPEEMLKD